MVIKQIVQKTFTKSLCFQSERYLSLQKLSELYRNWYNPKPEKPPYAHIVQIGDPILRNVCKNFEPSTINKPDTHLLVEQLKYVMHKYNAVGIAAPQIGLALRIFVMEIGDKCLKSFTKEHQNARQITAVPFTVFINPTVKVLDYTKITFPEACESVRGYIGDVPRYAKIQCTAFNEKGELFTREFSGWAARVVQHEMDHLDGKMYTDIMNRSTFSCMCWQEVNRHQGRINLPFYPKKV